MKLNIPLLSDHVNTARLPGLGKDNDVWFAPEVCSVRGTVACTAATAGTYTSAGGPAIPTGGRDLAARVKNPNVTGVTGAMTITLDVVLDDDEEDTAVATFHLPAHTEAGNLNLFPMGLCADFVPSTPANADKKIKSIVGLASVSNMVAGNKFEIITTPNAADFVHISCVDSSSGKFNLPKIIEIACGGNAAEFTRMGMTESNQLTITFKDRGVLEQFNRFNGVKGTVRIDQNKDETVLAGYILYSGYYVMANTERGAGDDEDKATTEGPYERFLVGYPRVAS